MNRAIGSLIVGAVLIGPMPWKDIPGPASTGIENVRPETAKLYQAPVDPKKLPCDLEGVWEQELPWTGSDE